MPHKGGIPFEVEVVISLYASDQEDAYNQVTDALNRGLRNSGFVVFEAVRATRWDLREWRHMLKEGRLG